MKIKLWPCPHVEIRIHVSEEMVKDIEKCRKSMEETGNGADCDQCSWNDVDLDGLTLCGDDVMDAVRAHLREKESER